MGHKLEEFKPIKDGYVGFYGCGPTVYNYAHLGNMRPYVFLDTLDRTLRFLGYEIKHVMNITDIGHLSGDADDGDDKMMVLNFIKNFHIRIFDAKRLFKAHYDVFVFPNSLFRREAYR